MPAINVFFKRRIELDRLNFRQRDMLRVGTVGVAAVKNRVRAAQGPEDGPAKPLSKRYAIRKSRLGLKNRRDLWGFGSKVILAAGKRRKTSKISKMGHMLDNLSIRKVSETTAIAGFTVEEARIKARANQEREAWLVFSPENRRRVKEAMSLIFKATKDRLVLDKGAGAQARG